MRERAAATAGQKERMTTALQEAREQITALREEVDKLTAPPNTYGVFLSVNQDGTLNGLFRNDGSRFVDVAGELGMDAAGRPQNFGSNGPSVIDYDNDGRLDLFVAGYGRNFLFHNEGGGGRFREVAEAMGVAGGEKATPSSWGDYDNDGRPDLYVSSYVDRPVNEHDFLYHHDGSRLADAMIELVAKHGATHGVQRDGSRLGECRVLDRHAGGYSM